MNIVIPNEIKHLIEDLEIKEIKEGHCSGDLVYKIADKYILKISNNLERLNREKKINDFLLGKLPVSKSIAYVIENGYAYYLKTLVEGDNLLSKKYLDNPNLLADILAKAINLIHSVDVTNCDFKNEESEGKVFVHGDLCLPNILAIDDEVSGIIDTESCGIGDEWIDYAWCIWSYEYNLGTNEYTPILLEKLGVDFNKEKYNKYIKIK